ncbi:glycosyl hydrolase [Deinococcus sp. KSM4-11]|uniref:NPCBM/NEW2 domain-containing protein n=1 Tax=Deinococcus sp. KSM4-11 TaxID=2568654 RepID=UPI0010A4B091|nr:NPCBM/NEW2 domain-containing protein [Deinococcus sp. KSM4-11]THF86231.1 glycosyl hydrolase [Deinococcus sp. KSM4-11]
MTHFPPARFRTAALLLIPLALAACSQSPSTPEGSAVNGGQGRLADGVGAPWVAPATTGTLKAMALSSGDNQLSSQTWTSATNGWGPVELNKSNGESGSGDGRTLTLGGKTYSTGVGVHANSTITYALGGQCSTFASDIGVDDEVGTSGSVVFQVWADGTKLYDSGTMTGSSATKSVSVSVSGKKELKLVVTDAGDGNSYDHGDWANARVTSCAASSTSGDPSGTTYTKLASEYGAFTVSGTQTVRFGADTRWIYKSITNSGTCTSTAFGSDPAVGASKSCFLVTYPSSTPAPTPTPTPTPSGNVTYKGPLVITVGGTYTGNYQSTNPSVPAITVKTTDPVIIENANVKGPGNLISGFKMNLTLRNTKGYGVNPNVSGKAMGRFLNSEDTVNLNVSNNYMEGTGGIYVRNFIGNSGAGQTIKILRNSVKNIDGRLSNGSGGYQNAFVRYQFVQFNSVRGLVNAEIGWNQVINEPGKSALEENINMYQSTGTSASRVKIHDNIIWGAYAINTATDSGYAGGGILLGDGNGSTMSTAGGYFEVYGNTIISTSNQGIGIAGGHDHNVHDNRVLSSGLLPNGQKIAAQNIGIYVWDQQGSKAGGVWVNNTVHDNQIAWMRYSSTGTPSLANTWTPDCVSGSCYNNTTLVNPATLTTESSEYALWQSKASAAGQSIGAK